jgi:hypothetical protein
VIYAGIYGEIFYGGKFFYGGGGGNFLWAGFYEVDIYFYSLYGTFLF